jgi:branched-chain amino acid transport system substrate-binding protein
MRRRHFLGTLAAGAALGLAAQAQAQETIIIGFGGGLTGYLAYYDGLVLNGAQMAVDEINAAGGVAGKYMIDLQVKDVRSEAAAAAVAGNELVAAGAIALISPCDADPAIAFAQPAQAAQVPVIAPCASTPVLFAAVGDYTFQTYTADNLQAAVSAKYAREQGYANAYILISPDTPYTEKLPLYFADAFQKMGGALVGQGTYAFGQQDFSAEVTNIKALDPQPDVIMTSAYEPDFPAFIKQLRAAGITTPVIGSDGIDSGTTLALGDIAEGVVFTTGGYPAPGSDLEAFYKAYVARYGGAIETDVAPFAAVAHEAVMMLAKAIETAGSTEGAAIRDALAAMTDFKGVTGSTVALNTPNNVALRDVALVRVTGGAKEHLGNMQPAAADVPAP